MECRPLQRRCTRPLGRLPPPPLVRFHDSMYWPASWGRDRRVVPPSTRDTQDLTDAP